MILIDGKKIAAELREELKVEVSELKSKYNKVPGLTVILIGDMAPSQIYVRMKEKAANEVGLKSEVIRYPGKVEEKTVLDKIEELNKDNSVSGILVQLPLPKHIDKQKVIESILPSKDVDGFHPFNYGKMTLGIDTFIPATPAGIVELIKRYKIDLSGKRCLVIGRSQIVGRPISILLSQNQSFANATVTVAHSRSKELETLCINSDIIISAIGIPKFLKSKMVSDNSIIIDVGISRVVDETSSKGYKIVGDVDFEDFSQRDVMITPVPGGVGPMTISMLLKNTLKACELKD